MALQGEGSSYMVPETQRSERNAVVAPEWKKRKGGTFATTWYDVGNGPQLQNTIYFSSVWVFDWWKANSGIKERDGRSGAFKLDALFVGKIGRQRRLSKLRLSVGLFQLVCSKCFS